jgi:HemY protein
MRKIIIKALLFILLLTTGIFALSKIVGYILVVLPGSTLEMPIWFFFILSLCLLLFLHLLARIIQWFWTLSVRFRTWSTKRKALRARHSLHQAVFSLLAANPETALKQLDRAEEFNADPLYLNVLKIVAQQQTGHYDKRDERLELLQTTYPKEKVAISLFQARMQIEENNLSAAQMTLEKIHTENPYHPRVLQMLAHVYYQQKKMTSLTGLLPNLEKACTRVLYLNYEQAVSLSQLTYFTEARALMAHWKKISSATQAQVDVLTLYVTQLLKFNLTEEAEGIVRKQIDQQASPALYLLYATIPHDAAQQILRVETWLKKSHGGQANLLFAAGQLCLRFQLWGKARDYFVSSLEQQPDPKIYAQLAQLYEQLGDKEKAAHCYQSGLHLAVT